MKEQLAADQNKTEITKRGITNLKTKDMVMVALFTALTAIGAFIKVPIPVVPFTLQFLFTTLAALLLGSKLGAISVALYVILGLIGLPIFAEGGGFWYIFKPSFGYLIGFVLATFLTGILVEKTQNKTVLKMIGCNFAGLLMCYACGMVYYYVICNYVIDTPIGVWPLFLYCFILAVPGDIAICIFAAVLAKRIRPVLMKMQ